MPFGMEKLECFGYLMVKNIRRYAYSFSQNSRRARVKCEVRGGKMRGTGATSPGL